MDWGNIRSAYTHVVADAAVSVLAFIGLVLARAFGARCVVIERIHVKKEVDF
jgi:Co/Zn/Cd efflux system component